MASTRLETLYYHVLVIAVLAQTACTSEPERRTAGPIAVANSSLLINDGEFLGDVFSNGVPVTESTYYITLKPLNAATFNRLHYFSDSMWGNPTASWMYEWIDPKTGQDCGSISQYVAGDTSQRAAERHRLAPNTPTSGAEHHCIRPGSYILTVLRNGSPIRKYVLDYLPLYRSGSGAKLIWNSTAGVNEAVEALNYDDTSYAWVDLAAIVDQAEGGYSETAALDIQNAFALPAKDTFTNVSSPSGNENDYFRFSVARSTSTWNLRGPIGSMLTRLFWDYARDRTNNSHYFESRVGTATQLPVIRWHTFGSHVTEASRVDTVALEVMRPNEAPDSNAVLRRTVQITRVVPYACASFERTLTWQVADQYLNAGCSTRGTNIQYRWRTDAGGSWSAYSPDTLFDFPGHSSTGAHAVTVEVRNTTSGQSATQTTNLTAQTGTVQLTGQTFITQKIKYIYRSNHGGQWFERFNPALPWNAATAGMQDTLPRVWPAGNYTEELRQDSSTSVLRRGRLHIVVCIPQTGCALAPRPTLTRIASVADTARFHLFGRPRAQLGNCGLSSRCEVVRSDRHRRVCELLQLKHVGQF